MLVVVVGYLAPKMRAGPTARRCKYVVHTFFFVGNYRVKTNFTYILFRFQKYSSWDFGIVLA